MKINGLWLVLFHCSSSQDLYCANALCGFPQWPGWWGIRGRVEDGEAVRLPRYLITEDDREIGDRWVGEWIDGWMD